MSEASASVSPPIDASRPPAANPTSPLRFIFEINVLYLFSAALMLAGCWMLMRSPLVEGGDFARKLKIYLLLQAYELLVIVAAAVIVRRLGSMSDAMTLLVIELALLLDPTSFGNAFYTFLTWEAVAVNVGAFVFALVKLAAIASLLRLRLSPRTLAAFALAAALIYLPEGPLAALAERLDIPALRRFTLPSFYYLLAWAPFALALATPPLGSIVRSRALLPDFMTDRQRHWLPRWFALLPFAVVLVHFFQSAGVHEIRFYGLYGAPALLAVGALVAANATDETMPRRIWLIDLTAAVALILSSGPLNIHFKDAIHFVTAPAPAFIIQDLTAAAGAGGVALLYIRAFTRDRSRAIAWRLCALAAVGTVYFTATSGAIGARWTASTPARDAAIDWIAAHPYAVYAPAILALFALAARWRNRFTWLLAGSAAIGAIYARLPIDHDDWILELIQAFLFIALAIEHRFATSGRRFAFYFLAFVAVYLGFVSQRFDPDMKARASMAIGAPLALAVVGLLTSFRGYAVIGFPAALIAATTYWRHHRLPFDPAAATILGAFALFGLALIVTFRKRAILAWFDRAAVAAPASEPPGEIVPESTESEMKEVVLEPHESGSWLDQPAPPDALAPIGSEFDDTPIPWIGETREQVMQLDPVRLEEDESERPSGAIADLLDRIFITDMDAGIALAHQVSETLRARWLSAFGPLVDSEAHVLFFDPDADAGDFGAVAALTDRGALFKSGDDGGAAFIAYPQIASIARSFGAAYVTGHAGQVFAVEGMNAIQARAFKRGLEALLADLAAMEETGA